MVPQDSGPSVLLGEFKQGRGIVGEPTSKVTNQDDILGGLCLEQEEASVEHERDKEGQEVRVVFSRTIHHEGCFSSFIKLQSVSKSGIELEHVQGG